MKRKKLSIFFALVLAMSMFLAACGGDKASTPSGDKKEGGDSGAGAGEEKLAAEQVLNILDSSEIPTMDPTKATDQVSFIVMNNVFEGLYRLDKDNKPTPGVAESYEATPDGKKYTFKLRQDAKWSDGSPVTAHDFVYSWQRAHAPETLSDYVYIMADIKNSVAITTEGDPLYGKVDQLGVKAVDDYTFEVELENPIPYFLSLTSFGTFMPQKKEFVEAQGDKYGLEANTVLYNGPFVLADWKHEEGWQYKKNDQYWDKDTVKLTEINVKVIKDVATGVNLYETGKVHRVGLSAEFVENFKDSPEYLTQPDTAVYFLRLNQTKNKALANVDIRKALNMAWDKQGMTDVIMNNGSFPADFLVPKDFTFSPNGEDFRAKYKGFNGYDTAKAKEHWEKGLAALGTDKLTIELLNYDSDSAKKVGEYLKDQLEKNLPGLTINIKQQPFKQKLALEDEGDYDISFAGWGPDYMDPMTFVDMFVTDGSHNQMGYSNPKFDELVKSAKTDLSDLNKRWENLQEAERILLEEDAAIAPMYQRGSAFLMQPTVKNWYKHPFGGDYSWKWTYLTEE